METLQSFFYKKIQALQPIKHVVVLRNEIITAEQGFLWAEEFINGNFKNQLLSLFIKYLDEIDLEEYDRMSSDNLIDGFLEDN